MKKYSVEPERRKGLIASAEKHLGKSPEEAVKFVDKVLAEEAIEWVKNPKTKSFFFVHSFAQRTAPAAQATRTPEQRESEFTFANGIRANLKTWAKYPSWTQLEAVYVMRGLDINKIMSKNILTVANESNFPTFKQINETNDLAQRCVRDGVIGANAHPVEWLNWSKDYDVPVIENLPKLVLEHFQKTMKPEQKAYFDALGEGKPEEVPTAPNSEIKRLFEVNDTEPKEAFYKEIKNILREKSQAGHRKPTGSELREHLKNNPDSAKHFMCVTKREEIQFDLSENGSDPKKITLDALQKTISRYTTVAK